ncbi:hypothetical protein [Pararhizobium gei]|uniref:hypothetical protein n=1 Tax=Pararhizobium gei TaxID=1395951 RepID=UPI0023DC8B8A|nr:hypothetical protein [Rhizobium gei]
MTDTGPRNEERTQTPRRPADDQSDQGNNAETPIPPVIKPGDHRSPNDPPLPLVDPIVDGGNL